MEIDLTAQLARGFPEVPSRSAVGQIAEALRRLWGQADEAPLDLNGVVGEMGVELVLSDLGSGEGGPQGLLTPLRNGGYRIEVDPTPPEGSISSCNALREEINRHRTRFVTAHELAHTLFYWQGRHGPERLVNDSAEQEQFCDALAAALLVPPAAARQLPLRPESVVSLHQTFDVSVEVAARALVEAHGNGVGWLMIVPDGTAEPWVQWGAETTRETVGPWRVLTRLVERVKDGTVAHGRLRWRSGRTTVAHGLYLTERKQLIVTARAA